MADLDEAIERVKYRYGFEEITLKDKQKITIDLAVQKKDVFALLPTGFGKSLTYIFVPLVLDEMHKNGSVWHTSLVISPLKALMADQLRYLLDHRISAVALTEDTNIKDIREGIFSVVFASPEAAILPKWKNIVRDNLKQRICLLVFDEAHCISSWGLDFRPAYRQVSVLQSIIDSPNLILTATATKKIQQDIYSHLGLSEEKTTVVAAIPDRPNIFLDVRHSSEKFEDELMWILNHLNSSPQQKKILIYVRSINLCYNLYLWIVSELDEDFFHNRTPSLENRRIEMFHANTDNASKDRILDEFMKRDGKIQLVISTVAFGMGINIPDIDIVVHWGVPDSCLSYWQEVGRCGRDGRPSYAVCYAFKRSLSRCKDEDLISCVKSEKCMRYSILEQFTLIGMSPDALKMLKITTDCTGECDKVCLCKRCRCCVSCSKQCKCQSKHEDSLLQFLE